MYDYFSKRQEVYYGEQVYYVFTYQDYDAHCAYEHINYYLIDKIKLIILCALG